MCVCADYPILFTKLQDLDLDTDPHGTNPSCWDQRFEICTFAPVGYAVFNVVDSNKPIVHSTPRAGPDEVLTHPKKCLRTP